MQNSWNCSVTSGSSDDRLGPYVLISHDSDDVAALFYRNHEMRIEIYQNGEDVVDTNFHEFKSALFEAEQLFKERIIPY